MIEFPMREYLESIIFNELYDGKWHSHELCEMMAKNVLQVIITKLPQAKMTYIDDNSEKEIIKISEEWCADFYKQLLSYRYDK